MPSRGFSPPPGQRQRTIPEQAALNAAQTHLQRSLVRVQGQVVGAVAALGHPPEQGAVNYDEIFVRDNVPVMLHLLLEGQFSQVRPFLDVCLELQSQEPQTLGVFPTSFKLTPTGYQADYGQRAIGQISSVDASLWWPVLAWLYVRRSGDRNWGGQHRTQTGLQRLLALLLQPHFDPSPLLQVNDGAFMVDRPLDVGGAPLDVQVLLYGCLRSARQLLALSAEPSEASQTLGRQLQKRLWALGQALQLHYWVSSRRLERWRRRPTEQYGPHQGRNPYNVQSQELPTWLQSWVPAQGGYLIGGVRTGRPDFRFFTLGNSLACLFGLLRPAQERALFRLVCHNRQELLAAMPLRLCHPPLEGEAWRLLTGADPKNRPWSYHNGGHWPCLLWFLVAAVRRHQQRHRGVDPALEEALRDVLEEAYGLQLQHLPRLQWPEYCDGPSGRWLGSQARTQQTWTAVGFLLLHRLWRQEPQAVDVLELAP